MRIEVEGAPIPWFTVSTGPTLNAEYLKTFLKGIKSQKNYLPALMAISSVAASAGMS